MEKKEYDILTDLIFKTTKEISKSNKSIIILGNTGEGKSALLNYLALKEMIAIKKNLYSKFILELCSSSNSQIMIGNKTESQTSFPNKWEKDNISFWDCPGFGDNTTLQNDLTNSFYIKSIFDSSEMIKIILVISENTLQESRLTKFFKLIEKFSIIFPNLQQILQSTFFVISKATETDENELKEFFKTILNDHRKFFKKNQAILMEWLCNEKSNIGFFKRPTEIGKLSYEGSNILMEKLNNLKFCQFSNIKIKITVSDQTEIYLNYIYDTILSEGILLFEMINKEIIMNFWKILQNYFCKKKLIEKIADIKIKLKNCFEAVNITTFLENMRILLKELNILIERYKELEKLILILKFIEKIINKEYSFEIWINKIRLQLIINELLQDPKYSNFNEILNIKGMILSTSEINKIAKDNSNFKTINIVSYDTLYFDEDLIYPEKNLIIVSPYWQINENILISLKGKDGESDMNDIEEIGMETNKDIMNKDKELSGMDGKPGNPGNNGGNFLGYGKYSININKLTIDVSGGMGGSGQDGENGLDGLNGMDACLLRVKKRDQSICKTIKNYPKVDASNMDKKWYEIREMLTYNDQYIDEYELIGEEGGKGGDTGAGGIGGFGGYRGKIILKEFKEKPILIEKNGANGKDGEPGKIPGKGGEYGKTAKGKYLHEIFCPSLKKIKPDNGIEIEFDKMKKSDAELLKEKHAITKNIVISVFTGAFIQLTGSLVSNLMNNGWIENPTLFPSNKRAEDGKINHNKNKINCKNPKFPISEIEFNQLLIIMNNDEKEINIRSNE